MKCLPGPVAAKAPEPAPIEHSDLWESWREHKATVTGILLTALLGGLPAAWFLGTPKYYAEASLYVSPTFIRNLTSDSEQQRQYDTFVQHHVRSITRNDILREALHRLGRPDFWKKPDETDARALERLQWELIVRRVPETYQVSIGLFHSKRDGLAELVNLIAGVYLEKAKAEEFFGQEQRVTVLNRERVSLDEELARKSEELSRLAGTLGVTNFSAEVQNPYDQVLVKSKENLGAARQRRLEAEALLEVLTPGDAASGAVAEAAMKDPELDRLRRAASDRRVELIQQSRGLEAGHPLKRAAEQELKDLEASLQAALTAARSRAQRQLLAKAEEDVRQARQVESGLDRAVAAQSSYAGQFARNLQRGMNLLREIERLRGQRNSIDDRLKFLTLEGSAPGFLRLFSAAETPEKPARGQRKLLFAVILGFALALCVAIPLSMEALDTRMRNPSRVERTLGFPPIGMLVAGPGEASPFADEHRTRLIDGLERAHQTTMARTFLVTSVVPRSGSAKVARILADGLCRRGFRAVLVEGNIFNASDNLHGPTDAIKRRGEMQAAIQRGGPLEADVLSADDAGGFSRPRAVHNIAMLMDELHRSYDFVLVHAAPLMVSADTEYLVHLTDVTLLVLDARKTRRAALERAMKLLERLQPGGLGAILNRVSLRDAGFLIQGDFRAYREYCRHRDVHMAASARQVAAAAPPAKLPAGAPASARL